MNKIKIDITKFTLYKFGVKKRLLATSLEVSELAAETATRIDINAANCCIFLYCFTVY